MHDTWQNVVCIFANGTSAKLQAIFAQIDLLRADNGIEAEKARQAAQDGPPLPLRQFEANE
jgi:hypothetical protein